MKRILRDKSGLSMLFVLAVMLVLLALGVSALVAASLSRGAVAQGQERNRLSLYVSSMERTMLASLQLDEGASLANPESLGETIARMAIDWVSANSSAVFELPQMPLELMTSDSISADYDAELFGQVEAWQLPAGFLLSGEIGVIITTQTENASITTLFELEFSEVFVQGNIVSDAGIWAVTRREAIN